MKDSDDKQQQQLTWENVKDLCPKLGNHVEISKHIYRKKICYVLKDNLSGESYRISREIYRSVGLMDGKNTLSQICQEVNQDEQEAVKQQETLVSLFVELYRASVISCNIPQPLENLLGKAPENQQTGLLSQLKSSVVFFKIPLFDPTRVIEKYYFLTRPLFTKTFLALVGMILFIAGIQLFSSFQQLSTNFMDTIFTVNNMLIIWLVYPCVKTIHEFAHAFAIKHLGGEVREIGVMMLLFFPVPYVDGSASSAFSSKWHRIGVSAAGIIAELTLAALALLLWARLEPGLLRTVLYNVIFIGGVSTLLFNGNPLVRFDGYYVLTDLLEIPNFGTKSRNYLWTLIEKYLFGLHRPSPTDTTKSEKSWFLLYGVSSFLYRLTIYGSIFYLLSSRFAVFGTVFGIFAIGQLIFLPLFRKMSFLHKTASSKELQNKLIMRSGLILSAILLFFFLLPLPYYSQIEGVLWPPKESIIKSATSGVIQGIPAKPENSVKKGDILFELEDFELEYHTKLLRSQLRELQLREKAAFTENSLTAKIITERSQEISERLQQILEKRENLTIQSPLSGIFIVPRQSHITGKYTQKGEILGFVIDTANSVRLLIKQADIELITKRTKQIKLVIASQLDREFTAQFKTINPQTTLFLPTPVLGKNGGGQILTDPTDAGGQKLMEEMFLVDLEITEPVAHFFIGNRVYLRFLHSYEPLFYRTLRKLRQLFLSQLNS